MAFESPKPYAHPVRTLGGALVTGYRPSDHRWHKGVQMTASHLSGHNFWGGHSYLTGEGYRPRPERVGAMRHDGFAEVTVARDRLDLAERLTWLTRSGDAWARERRTLAVHSAEPDEGAWTLDWGIHLTNTRGAPLRFGSPTTAGRERAGYTGLQWRGPRDVTSGQVLLPTGPTDQETAMGTPAADAPWLAFRAERDGTDTHTTLVFAHAPGNTGRDAIHPSHWFVRSTPIPTVAFSWAFFEEFTLPPDASFSFRYRLVVADGAWDGDRIADHLARQPW